MEKGLNTLALVGIMWVNSSIITSKEEESIFRPKYHTLVSLKIILSTDRDNSDFPKKIQPLLEPCKMDK